MTKLLLIALTVLSASAAFSKSLCNSNSSAVAADLQSLIGVTRLNDCQIDVVTQIVGQERQYSVYARDLFLCSLNKAYCKPHGFVFVLPKSCPVARTLSSVRDLRSFNRPDGDLNSFIEFNVNSHGTIMSLRFGEVQFNPYQLHHDIDCAANPTGEPQ